MVWEWLVSFRAQYPKIMNGARFTFTTPMPCMMLSVSNLSGSTKKTRTEQKDLCGSLTLHFLFVTDTTHDKCMRHPQFSLVSSWAHNPLPQVSQSIHNAETGGRRHQCGGHIMRGGCKSLKLIAAWCRLTLPSPLPNWPRMGQLSSQCWSAAEAA
jgi:hypothetical protein